MPTINANGIDIYYEEAGKQDDPVILLIMGLGTQMTAWPEELVNGLADSGYRVVSFDNRDIGLSTILKGAKSPNLLWAMFASRFGLPLNVAYTLTDMAADAVALMDGLGIAKAHVVGASMGGMIAQIVASEWPDRVLSLTSVMSSSGAPGLPGPSADIRKQMLAPRLSNPTRDQAIEAGVKIIKAMSYPSDPARAPDAFEVMAGQAFDRSYSPDGTKRQLAAIIADGSRVERLRAITTPTLAVHGGADRLVPLACGQDVVRHVADARMEVIDEMAHDLPPSQIGRMTELIVGHVSAVG